MARGCASCCRLARKASLGTKVRRARQGSGQPRSELSPLAVSDESTFVLQCWQVVQHARPTRRCDQGLIESRQLLAELIAQRTEYQVCML